MSELFKCPQCGWEASKVVVPHHNFMNEYVFANSGKMYGVLNSEEVNVTIPANPEKNQPEVKVVRKDKYVAPVAKVAEITVKK